MQSNRIIIPGENAPLPASAKAEQFDTAHCTTCPVEKTGAGRPKPQTGKTKK